MDRDQKKFRARINFTVSLIVIFLLFALSFFRVRKYNNTLHYESFSGEKLFSEDYGSDNDCTVNAIPRGSTWTKAFDLNNEGITEHNYRAYTYDFPVRNNTSDEIADIFPGLLKEGKIK